MLLVQVVKFNSIASIFIFRVIYYKAHLILRMVRGGGEFFKMVEVYLAARTRATLCV